jgi:polygalacturonase
VTSSIRQLQAAIDACAAAGGGTVVVPPGNHVTGTLWLKSNITIHLEAGARLLGSHDKSEFPLWVSDWEGSGVKRVHAPMFAGEN